MADQFAIYEVLKERDEFVVRVAAYSDRAAAQRMVDALEASGVHAWHDRVSVNDVPAPEPGEALYLYEDAHDSAFTSATITEAMHGPNTEDLVEHINDTIEHDSFGGDSIWSDYAENIEALVFARDPEHARAKVEAGRADAVARMRARRAEIEKERAGGG